MHLQKSNPILKFYFALSTPPHPYKGSKLSDQIQKHLLQSINTFLLYRWKQHENLYPCLQRSRTMTIQFLFPIPKICHQVLHLPMFEVDCPFANQKASKNLFARIHAILNCNRAAI